MPFEFALMVKGYLEVKKEQRRESASWVSVLLSPHLDEPITPAMLLGEKTHEEDVADRAAAAEKRLERMLEQHAEAVKKGV